MGHNASIASLPQPGWGRAEPPRPGLRDLLASAPWLILVYLAMRAGWSVEQITGLLLVLVPVMGISTQASRWGA